MIPIFRKMAKLVQGPTRFTHPEWTTSNLTHYANAESERAAAERLVEESKRLSEETAKRTEKTQRDVSKKLGKFKYFLMLYICHHMVEFFSCFDKLKVHFYTVLHNLFIVFMTYVCTN